MKHKEQEIEQEADSAQHSEDAEDFPSGSFGHPGRLGRGSRYLRDATPKHRVAALIAALLFIVLLVASIALFFVIEMELLRPTPTTVAESHYLRARDAEADAVAAAQITGASIDTYPAVVTARISLADAQIQLGQMNAASRTIQLVIRHNPDNIQALLLQANIYEISGNYEDAVNAYQLVLDKIGNSDTDSQREALRGLGSSLIALGRTVEALDALSKAASIPPASITLHIAAGELALELERWQDAATHFYIVLFFYPDNQIALDHLAILERDHSTAAAAALEALIDGGSDLNEETP